MRVLRLLLVGVAALATWISAALAEAPKVRPERPRVFWRAKAPAGPSVEKVREWMSRPEYKARTEKLPRTTMGNAILYLVNGDEAAGRKAVARLKAFRVGGSSPSYTGIACQQLSALHDWLHDHPDYDEAGKRAVIAQLEKWGDTYTRYLKGGPTPFYSRISGALAGLTVIALSLDGDSPKAADYAALARNYLVEKYGTIRQAEDGATGGGCYGYHHQFTDLGNLAAAWRSATDWDAADWIAKNQGDWLRRQMLFHIWMSNAKGWRFKDGDMWGGKTADRTQYLMHVAAIGGMYRDGFGRSYLDLSAKRWGTRDFHTEYVWEWFVFNDPTIKARPLAELGRLALFSPKLHGFVAIRSGWSPDATVIHFKAGEACDHHGSGDQGKFTVFKHEPLAIENGGYIGGYRGSMHLYYRSPWSSNCVVFTGEQAPDAKRKDYRLFGHQPRIDFDGFHSWKAWKAERDRRYKRPPTGVVVAHEANEKFARVVGDMAGAVPDGCGWTRELVFLGYKYLLVLDRVKAAAGVTHRWLLHSIKAPRIDGKRIVIDNGQGRLFCRTLLPPDAKLVDKSGPGHEYEHIDSGGQLKRLVTKEGKHWDKFNPKKTPPEFQLGEGRVDVEAPAGDAVYLHVLFPTDTKSDQMPPCKVQRKADGLVVTVGGLTYTFGK